MKVTRVGEQAGGASHRPASPRNRAKEAAIERSITRYIWLTCGHNTDWDKDLVFEVFRPLGPLKFYCEKCHEWRDRMPKTDPPEYLPEPLF